jgi:hypothetical protein
MLDGDEPSTFFLPHDFLPYTSSLDDGTSSPTEETNPTEESNPLTLQSLFPAPNSHGNNVVGPIVATFDSTPTLASVTPSTFVVHGGFTGRRTSAQNTLSVTQSSVSNIPQTAYFPGEELQVSLTGSLSNSVGGLTNPLVRQFRVGVTAGSGTLANSGQNLGTSLNWTSAAGDFDRDGDVDIMVGREGGQPISLWLNNGFGVFSAGASIGAATTQSLTPGDFDGDGDLDVVAGNTSRLRLLTNDGYGNFAVAEISSSTYGSIVATGDIDRDGDLDLVQSPTNSNSPDRLLINNGNGIFTEGQSLGTPSSVATRLGDVDGDGDLDLLAVKTNTVQVWLNGSGTFTNSGQSLGVSLNARALATGDLDQDGDLDFILGRGQGSQLVWLNNGSGVFTDSGQALGTSGTSFVELGDFDFDGDLDAIYQDSTAIALRLNDGFGFFGTAGQTPGTIDVRGSVKPSDLDGDGDLDLFVPNYQGASRVWLNTGTATGAIQGTKWHDQNGNGTRDSGEPGLSGWTVFIDLDADGILDAGEVSTTTDANGAYSLGQLRAGIYRVAELNQPGWQSTNPSTGHHVVSLYSGQTATEKDFSARYTLGTISGSVWNDYDGDGQRDGDEPGIGGWTVYHDANLNGTHDGGEVSVSTSTTGAYQLTVAEGNQRISLTIPVGWQRTVPATNGYHEVSVIGNGSIANLDFAGFLIGAGEIHGIKWNDIDQNGSRDVGEPVLADWSIFLDMNLNGIWNQGEPLDVTDANGEYAFRGLAPGNYTVAEIIKFPWAQSYPANAGGNEAGDGFSSNSLGFLVGPTLPLETSLSDFSVYLASEDWTGSHSTLVDEDGTVFGSVTELMEDQLHPQGNVLPESAQSTILINWDDFRAAPQFAGITGAGYSTVIIDTGIDLNHPFFGPDTDNNGVADRIVYHYDFGNNDADASDVNNHGSNVASIVASSNASFPGMAPGANIIALKVFTDAGSGTFAAVEQALQWVVNNAVAYNIASVNMSLGDSQNHNTEKSLYGIGDELAALDDMNVIVVASSGNSFYSFGSTMGVGYPAASPDVISVGAVYDANVGSVSYGSGASATTTAADRVAPFSQRHPTLMDILAPGAAITGASASGGLVTMHGTSQAAPHIAGISVLAQQLAMQTFGRRLSRVELSQLLSSSAVTVNDGDDENDNVINTGLNFPRVDVLALAQAILDLGSTGAPGTHSVALSPNQTLTGINFGNYRTLSRIGGEVYQDLDHDGIKDAGENPLSSWTVYLDRNGNGVNDGNDFSTLTSSNGSYAFEGLTNGSYVLRVEPPTFWQITQPTSGSHLVSLSAPVEVSRDFGAYLPTNQIRGAVWNDANGNGVQEGGDVSLPGRTVFIDSNGDGVYQQGRVEPDDYQVGTRINSITPGVSLTAVGAPWVALDGKVVSLTDDHVSTGTRIFASDRTIYWNDGLQLRADFTESVASVAIDVVADDGADQGRLRAYNAAGILLQEVVSEVIAAPKFVRLSITRGVADIAYVLAGGSNLDTVVLDNLRFGIQERSVTTTAAGLYTLAHLVDGTHVVDQVLPAQHTEHFPAAGSYQVAVANGQSVTGRDFASRPNPSRIEGIQWSDRDGNGVRDSGEPVLPGWTVYLDSNDNGNLDAGEPQTTTDAFGAYQFPNLVPGRYVVARALQPGWTSTSPGVRFDVAYKNSTYDLGSVSFPPTNAEIGETIVLSAPTTVSELAIGLTAQGVAGTADVRARIYANDGPNGRPGTMLWDSGIEPNRATPAGEELIVFPVPNVAVPATFTWTLWTANAVPNVTGLPVYGPPTVGATDSGWFGSPGNWVSLPYDYMARVTANTGKTGQRVVDLGAGQVVASQDFGSQGSLDFGDAPPGYPTLLVNDGARHVPVVGVRLGSALDSESEGVVSLSATGDDATGTDDEDGVVFSGIFVSGQSASVSVTASSAGALVYWIDWNRNGAWELSERGTHTFSSAGTESLTVPVPTTITSGTTAARFRFSTNASAIQDPTGAAPDGEVEDYIVNIDLPLAIQSIVYTGASPTNANSVEYVVTFNEPVELVSPADFALTVTGITGASISGIVSNGVSQTVTVNTGTGSGTLRLDAVPNGTLRDLAGYALTNGFTGGTTITLDRTPPQSSLAALTPNASSLQLTISATGSDPAGPAGNIVSGIAEYDLFVAIDHGSFSKFATVPVGSPSTVYTATSNHTYFFRSVAKDHAGNIEAKSPNQADTFTRVGDLDKPTTQVSSATANSTGLFSISVHGSDSGGSQLASFDLYVAIDSGTASFVGSVSAGQGSGGIHVASISYQGIADGNQHTYRFYSRGRDSLGNVEDAPATWDLTVSQTFTPPPALQGLGIDVQSGVNQRSFVNHVDLLFSSATGVEALLQPGRVLVERFALDSAIVNPGTGTNLGLGSLLQTGSRLRVTFASELGTDGFYRIRADINGDGDFNDPGEAFEFHRLRGDANGDAIVNALDSAVVDRLFGSVGSNLDGDLDGNGVVNSTDKTYTLRTYRGRKLADHLKPLLDD